VTRPLAARCLAARCLAARCRMATGGPRWMADRTPTLTGWPRCMAGRAWNPAICRSGDHEAEIRGSSAPDRRVGTGDPIRIHARGVGKVARRSLEASAESRPRVTRATFGMKAGQPGNGFARPAGRRIRRASRATDSPERRVSSPAGEPSHPDVARAAYAGGVPGHARTAAGTGRVHALALPQSIGYGSRERKEVMCSDRQYA
jgi:hypothetical protein